MPYIYHAGNEEIRSDEIGTTPPEKIIALLEAYRQERQDERYEKYDVQEELAKLQSRWEKLLGFCIFAVPVLLVKACGG